MLRDQAELGLYLKARKAEESGDGLTFQLKRGGETKAISARWHADEDEIQFSIDGDVHVAKLDESGVISNRAVEALLAKIG